MRGGRKVREKCRRKWERRRKEKNAGKSRGIYTVKMLNLVNICKAPFHTLHIFAK
jgi:hypothetical protein